MHERNDLQTDISHSSPSMLPVDVVRAVVLHEIEGVPYLLLGFTGDESKHPAKRFKYELLGGQDEDNMGLAKAAGREVLEEAGVPIAPLSEPILFDLGVYAEIPKNSFSGRKFQKSVILAAPLLEVRPRPSGEHKWVGWVPLAQVLAEMNDNHYNPDTAKAIATLALHEQSFQELVSSVEAKI